MKKLTILVASFNAVGHVNACAGATKEFLKRGHRVIFLLEESFRGKLASRGFEEFIYEKLFEKPGDVYADMLLNYRLIGPEPIVHKVDNFRRFLEEPEYLDELVYFNNGVKQALVKYKPDLIWYDGNEGIPQVLQSGLPWVHNLSIAPTFYEFNEDIPPGGSGFPSNETDRTEWNVVNEIRNKIMYSKVYNDLWERLGYDRYPGDIKLPEEYLMAVYAYPDELNYDAIRDKVGWFNLEVFNQVDQFPSELIPLSNLVPEQFVNDNLDGKFSGKLIYVSMGSMGSIDLALMNRILSPLGKTNHKYIVSKGPRHKEYSLPANMWGDKFLPQTAILPHCDLVITHGGNNTVTETFARGKPIVILPQFLDQFDNAQRLTETGFGARVDTYHFTETELVDAVDRVLYDQRLCDKIKNASERMSSLNRHEELAIKIEQLMEAREQVN